jgi:hypothetical protein
LLLNSDTEVTKNAIDELVNFAEKHDDAGVIGSQLLNKDGSIQPSVFYLPTLTRTVKQFWFKQKNYLDKYAPKSDKPVEVEAVVGASFLITPQAREKVGLLNESYFMFFEDLEYCKKVRETGLKVYYLPGSRVYHYHGASGKNVTDSDNQWRRLIPSSKTYHGLVKYYLIYFIIKSSQIAAKLVKVIKK